MTLSIAAKQNYIYLALIIFTSIGSVVLYRLTQQQWIMFREAETQFDHKEYETAISLYKKSVAAGYPLSKVALKLARAHVAMGHFQEAIDLYKGYLLEHPQDKQARLEFARALSYVGNFKESEREYKSLLKNEHPPQ